MICHYCSNKAKLVSVKEIYPHRPDLYSANIYLCKPCDAYVGCHKGTDKPLGILANKELRHYRRKAHKEFDDLWKLGFMLRGEAYSWLSTKLCISKSKCHIAMFDIDMCKKVIEVCNEYY